MGEYEHNALGAAEQGEMKHPIRVSLNLNVASLSWRKKMHAREEAEGKGWS